MKLKKFNFKTVNSTNDAAIRIIKKTNYKFGIIVAETQKKGRGQYGKKWISYKGNLFISIFFLLDKINLSISKLTKINCLLVKKILSEYSKKKILIKPPNDLLINKKKICGILQEIISKGGKSYLIVGIGINMIKNPNIKNYPTTNLIENTNSKIMKHSIIYKIKKLYENFIPKLMNISIKTMNKI